MKIAALLIAIAACGGAKPAPAPPPAPAASPDAAPAATAPPANAPPRPASVTDEMIATTDHVLAVLTQVATDVHGAADCEAAAVALGADASTVKAITADAARLEREWTAAGADAQQWFSAVYEARFRDNNAAMAEASASCQDNADFMAAFKSVNAH